MHTTLWAASRQPTARQSIRLAVLGVLSALCLSCTDNPPIEPGSPMPAGSRAIFLHHSTGGVVWSNGLSAEIDRLNTAEGTSYSVNQTAYPDTPWPWDNYPSDYYRLWVGGEGSAVSANIYNLETLCSQYDLIVFKHCYPVNDLEPDTGSPDPASTTKTLENYQAAYNALKARFLDRPDKRFLVWTGAVRLEVNTNPAAAQRLKTFRDWVINTWDQTGDNIFVFDFWQLETGGGLYLLPGNAASATDDHPSDSFAQTVALRFAERLMDVFQGNGDIDPLTGY